MADSTVIRDLSEVLRQLLKQNIPELGDENAIILGSPADIEATMNTKLLIFLFQVLPNGYLRNIEPEPISLNERGYPPLVVDIFYLFTPYAQTKETEIIVFEKVMQTLYDNAVLKENSTLADIWPDSLRASKNDEIRVIPHTLSIDELNRLWGIFPDKAYKTSLSYILTPVRIPSKRTEKITRVIEREIRINAIEE